MLVDFEEIAGCFGLTIPVLFLLEGMDLKCRGQLGESLVGLALRTGKGRGEVHSAGL